MTRDTSPPPLSDDSAVGSTASCATNGERNSVSTVNSTTGSYTESIYPHKTSVPSSSSRPKPKRNKQEIDKDELRLAAMQMRGSNVGLISRSIRTVLYCFDDLDIEKFEPRSEYLINFISNGINTSSSSIQRPVSILWPDSYEKMVEQLASLDAFLLNTQFKENPVDWMLRRGLTSIPKCRQCKEEMTLKYENNTVRWHCLRSQACLNYIMPIQRPSFFNSYEFVGLDKLLSSVYFWSTCTPGADLYAQMNIEPHILDGIWKRIQNVCRTALEKSYPRHRLTNVVSNDSNQALPIPIDLVSIKLNDVYVVCAKHPYSNLVRLGLHIPHVSRYTFVDLTESWFAHGANVRVSESKFLGLAQKRTDIKLDCVQRYDMVSKDGRFNRESAFGYLISQLTHVLKDFQSTSLSRESLKLILAEMQWRELYGTTPFDAFTNIVTHMAMYGEASDWYSEPSVPVECEVTLGDPEMLGHSMEGAEYVYAEKHFYATIEPIDKDGKVISRIMEPPNPALPPQPDVRFNCHFCNSKYESFDFSMHIVAHVETNRKEHGRQEYLKKKVIECKHCFRLFKREHITMHSTIFRSHLQMVQYGCRICCIRLNDRASYLQHMRRLHFEHETPYRCPSCPYSSSFQRDVFIHFQEEHRHSFVLLCPFCLRGFTVKEPEKMTIALMKQLSILLYNHISEHYVVSKGYTCSNCSLCFLDKDSLRNHKQRNHNPLDIPSTNNIKLQPFIVLPEEEKYCVKALPMELFVANKRPNLTIDQITNGETSKSASPLKQTKTQEVIDLVEEGTTDNPVATDQPNVSESVKTQTQETKKVDDISDSSTNDNSITSDSDTESYSTAFEDGTIVVRGLSETQKFLDGGEPALMISKNRASTATGSSKTQDEASCSSQKLIEFLSKMKRADGVIPNQSVILTPKGKPGKCCECYEYITVDHFVASIYCQPCKYLTYCPRAATKHRMTMHSIENK